MKSFFMQRIFPFFSASHPSDPQFDEFSLVIALVASAVPPPIPLYSEFVSTLMSARPLHPRAAKLYREYVRWMLQSQDEPAIVINSEKIQILTKVFEKIPSIENVQGLVEALRVPNPEFDPAMVLLGKLVNLNVPPLILFVLVHGYVRKCKESELDACRGLFTQLRNSEADSEKDVAIELILNRKARDLFPLLDK
jgi:hypothetical protein